eukprot:g83049.t1
MDPKAYGKLVEEANAKLDKATTEEEREEINAWLDAQVLKTMRGNRMLLGIGPRSSGTAGIIPQPGTSGWLLVPAACIVHIILKLVSLSAIRISLAAAAYGSPILS